MRIAVLGAGHGGQAMAADLTLSGHEVRLAAVPEHASKIRLLRGMGGIRIEGVSSCGRADLPAVPAMMSDDPAAAIKGADIIFVVVPAFAQDPYMDLIAERGEKGQLAVFACGGFSALELRWRLLAAGRGGEILAGETSSFVYTAKIKSPGAVHIKDIKRDVLFAALPQECSAGALERLNSLLPRFRQAHSVWQTSFTNPSALLHTITTLLNMSRIELMGPYRNSHYDITPGVARVMEAVDDERVAIARRLYPDPLLRFRPYWTLLPSVKLTVRPSLPDCTACVSPASIA
ncbi:MAG: NAD(P)-binding domain-containing protein [Elusimicrobia bacterium]|nr:NAD(P)-binding domain-containing protein [Elusimicrobiota bacterium]